MAKINNDDSTTLSSSSSKPKLCSQASILTRKNPIGVKSPGRIEKAPTSEISFKDFLDFLRTAYQINESIEGNVPEVEVNWKDIATNQLVASLLGINDTQIKKASEQTNLQNAMIEAKKEMADADMDFKFDPLKKSESTSFDKLKSFKRDSLTEISNKKKILDCSRSMEHLMKRKLNEVIQEGLLDSVLPYVVPKQNVVPHSAKKPGAELKKTTTVGEKVSIQQSTKDKSHIASRRKSSSNGEVEVEIHVCDEVKNLKRDFKCSQKLLVSKMGYFAEVTTGQKLEDMDISVHCDITIFDWLMRWVKKDLILDESWPILDAANVVPILVSAAFLQMDPLLQDCLAFCRRNMNDIIKTSTNLSCLNDSILTRLANLFSNSDLELLRDKKDKIQSRLYCKLIVALTETSPEPARGHFSSLSGMYRCGRCDKLVLRQLATRIPCRPSNTKMDRMGNVHGNHVRDTNWNLNDYIRILHDTLRTWRAVYWRLWGDCHFLMCSTCRNHFPAHQMHWCCHHADPPQFFTMEHQRSMTFPIGRYPCCGERAYRFEVLRNESGCQFKDHVPVLASERDFAVHKLFMEHHLLLALDPPQLMFPERLTRLVSSRAAGEGDRGASAPEACRELLWWEGLELAPPRPRPGLLSRIWDQHQKKDEHQSRPSTHPAADPVSKQGGSGNTTSRVIRRQTSILDTPMPTDFNDAAASPSSDDDSSSSDSDNSEESGAHKKPPRHVAAKSRRRQNTQFLTAGHSRADGSRQWVPKLSIRSNQDNQREYEERAVRQMSQLLTRRTCADSTSLFSRPSKAHSHLHNSTWNNHITPIGGTYVRLEQEWKETHCHSHGCHGGLPNRQRSLGGGMSARPKLRAGR